MLCVDVFQYSYFLSPYYYTMYFLYSSNCLKKISFIFSLFFLMLCFASSTMAKTNSLIKTDSLSKLLIELKNTAVSPQQQEPDPLFIQDSLALVDFYYSTNGANWTQGYYSTEAPNFNWLTTAPLSTWHGVSVNIQTHRVIQLFFDNEGLSGTIPNSFQHLTALKTLHLSNGDLTGNLSFLSTLVNLQFLELWGNHFTGDLSYLLNLTQLQTIYLNNNNLAGPIPDFFQNISNLKILELANCNIGTEIPSFIGDLTKLQIINFNNCNLFGTIPTSFYNLINLADFEVATNKLHGIIPISTTVLNKITFIYIAYNAFNFTDLEELFQKFTKPQTSLWWMQGQEFLPLHVTNVNNTKKLAVSAGGLPQNITYKWYKKHVLVTTNVGDSTFFPTTSGFYRVVVSSSLLTDIVLTSNSLNTYIDVTDFTGPNPDIRNLPDTLSHCVLTVTPPTATTHHIGTISATTNDPLTYAVSGNYIIHWVYDDGIGNQVFQNQNIIIDLTNLPVPNVKDLPTIQGNCSVNVSNIPTAIINCSTNINATTTNPLVYNQIGTYVITWKYDDGNGHIATQNQTVIVNNNPIPTIATLPDVTGECSVVITNAPTATNCNNENFVGTTNDPLIYQSAGVYTINWKYDDSQGNVSYQTQTVIVSLPNTEPVLDAQVLPDLFDKCSLLNIAIPTATDACGNKIYGVSDIDLTDLSEESGTITWSFTDANGMVIYQTQNWSIFNDVPPVPLELNLPNLSFPVGTQPILEYPLATTHCDGENTPELYSAFDFNIPGVYILNWIHHDTRNYNLQTLQDQILTITPNANSPKPDVNELPILTGECSVEIVNYPTATSVLGEKIIGIPSEQVFYAVNQLGVFGTMNWTYDDGHGNLFVQYQKIFRKDITAPIPVLPELPTITSNVNEPLDPYDYMPMALDNCDGEVTGQPTNWDWSIYYSTPGTYNITWQYYDSYGNISSQQQTLIITNPNALPQPTVSELPTITSECSVNIIDIPTAIGADGQTIQGTTANSTSYAAQGTYTITWTYDDGIGNFTTQDQLVIIKDESAPIPDMVSLPELISACTLSEISIPTATDNCSGIIYGSPDIDISGGFAQGTDINITWTFSDANGNSTTQIQHVVVNDHIPPVPDSESLPDIIGECSATEFGYINTPTATDNCSGLIIGVPDIDINTLNTQGTYLITYTFTDNNGNSSTQTQNVIIKDVTAPVLVGALPGDNNGQCLSSAPLAPDASMIADMYTDNCSQVTATLVNTLLTGNNITGWELTYTYDVSDAAGNNTTANVIYSGKDNIAPEVITNDISVSLDETGHAIITAEQINNGSYDNCSELSYQLDKTDFTCSDLGLVLVTLTVTDASGNSAAGYAVVSVEDLIAPTITAPANKIVSNDKGICGATITNLGNPIATDNCSIDNIVNDAPAIFPVGNTIVTWTVTDTYGNATSATQQVTVNDTEAPTPVVGSLPSITGQQCSIVIPIPKAIDNCAGTINGTTTNSLVFNSVGTFVITWNYNDGNGNISTQRQTIVVTKDLKAPVPTIAVLPSLTGQCSVTVTNYPTATDNCSGLITATTKSALSYITQGTFTIVWTYTDVNGNVTNQNQTVVVTDNIAPVPNVLVLPAITAQCSVTIVAKPTATDNCKGTITATTANPLTYTTQGTYTITWSYTDGKNIATQTQSVIVKDNLAPVPNLAVLPTITGQCSATITTKPTATDNCKGTITATTTNPLSYTTQGTYTIVWTYADGNGNSSTQTQTVIISDNIAPVPTVAVLPTITGQCSAAITTIPKATDNCKGTITATTTNPLSYATQGTYTIVWNYADGNGNTTTQNQTVIVKDNTLPVVKTKAVTITLINGAATLTASQVDNLSTDNCGIATRTLSKTNFDCSNIGANIVTLIVTDVNGNSASATATVTVTGLIPAVTIASVPTSTVYTGGVATNLYLGYGSQTTKLQVTAPTTGAPYTYIWTGANLNLLSATNIVAPIFTPIVGGYYTYTVTAINKYGCASTATINICVTDIRVTPTLNSNVYICHNNVTQTVTVAQVPTYIKTTTTATDKLGSCSQIACAAPATIVAIAPTDIISINANTTANNTDDALNVTVMPNPTSNYFTLKLESKNLTPVNLRVVDAIGRVVDNKPNQASNSTLQIGFNYGSGIYFAEFIQGNKRKVIQLIKARG